MGFGAYIDVLKVVDARNALLLGLLIRIPMWAGAIVLTLHVVSTLGSSYSAAGLVTMASTVAVAVSGPWRGRRLDRIGLRATIGPQLVVLAVVWGIAPWVGYWPLLVLAAIGGLFVVPTFSIVRQILITAVSDGHRKTVLSLDSLATELSFMVGPVLGVLAAQYLDTRVALFGFEMMTVLGGLLIWALNPRLLPDGDDEPGAGPLPARSWLSPMVLAILAASAAATVVLSGTDIGIVAALRDLEQPQSIGWVLAVWGLGSAIGAILYGALHKPIPVFWLLLALGLTTLPVALAGDPLTLAALLFVAGFLCAPTITATIDHLSRAVPASVRGEAMGWHGSALTLGSAAGAPVAGVAIDHGGWQAGFVVTALVGVLVAGLGLAVMARRSAATPARIAEPVG